MVQVKKVIITPETHWDREWYLPFQSYRAKLVILVDRLLEILKKDPKFTNFTLDGQAVVLQDYLEIKAEREAELKKYFATGQISAGPMYILPDVYLVSGESMIRNLILGHKVVSKFGKVMKCAYIPDPFGHVAQLPQIIAGFDIPTVMFARGFGNEWEEQKLNVEFNWQAPGNAASVIGIHLIRGYGSVAGLNEDKNKNGIYESAIGRCEKTVQDIAAASCTGIIPLNNGSDHLFPQPFIPEMIEQWNKTHPEMPMMQADFGTYSEEVIAAKPQLKNFMGELHGAKYQHILSGVLSARMWIKQYNMKVQTHLERYTEPAATLNWLWTKGTFDYPTGQIWTAWQTLLRNHPHDSICGCSIDEVHDIDMKERFFNAESIAEESTKETLYQLSSFVPLDDHRGERTPFLVFNPLPWDRTELVKIKIITDDMAPPTGDFKIKDENENEYLIDFYPITLPDRFNMQGTRAFEMVFIAKDVPALGYKAFYVYPGEEPTQPEEPPKCIAGTNWIENPYYKIEINANGTFNLIDKTVKRTFSNLGGLEDTADWGDEYDYSWGTKDQKDQLFTSKDVIATITTTAGNTGASAKIEFTLPLPTGLSDEPKRTNRRLDLVNNRIEMTLNLVASEPIVKINIMIDNQAKDHRIRMAFPTGIATNHVAADGHFAVLNRELKKPDDKTWTQAWVPTHHQNKFISVADTAGSFTIMNKGLPEYEVRPESDGSTTMLITLLRCIGWLSRADMASRKGNAGPALRTPTAQCLGTANFEMAITSAQNDWLNSNTNHIAEQYIAPLQPIIPQSVGIQFRMWDTLTLFMGMMMKNVNYPPNPILPSSLSFMKLTNPKLTMTALKKAEKADAVIVRLLNLAQTAESDRIEFYAPIKEAILVNYNEDVPLNPIKATMNINGTKLMLKLDPCVLATLQLKF